MKESGTLFHILEAATNTIKHFLVDESLDSGIINVHVHVHVHVYMYKHLISFLSVDLIIDMNSSIIKKIYAAISTGLHFM